VPGLWVGGSIVYDNIGQSQPASPATAEAAAARRPRAATRSAPRPRGRDRARHDQQHRGAEPELLRERIPDPTYVPHLFYGGYAQAAYKVFQQRRLRCWPFVRYEIYNTAAGFGSLPASAGRREAARRARADHRRELQHRRRRRAEGRLPRLPHVNKRPTPRSTSTSAIRSTWAVGFSF
jgi:hypothetical protein